METDPGKALEGQPHILQHLASAQLEDQKVFHLLCKIAKFICREGPEGDGSEKTDLKAGIAQPLDGPLGDPGGRPVSDEDEFYVIRPVKLMRVSFRAMTWYFRSSVQLCSSMSRGSRISPRMILLLPEPAPFMM